MEENITQQIIFTSLDQCSIQLQHGLEMLGMYSAFQQLPILFNLSRPGTQMALNIQKLLQLPVFQRRDQVHVNTRKSVIKC